MRYLFSFQVLFSYTIFIIFISVIPVPPKQYLVFSGSDKVVHFLAYISLAFLAVNTFKIKDKKIRYLKVFLYCFFVGFFIECIQYFIPCRRFELFDILANSLGALTGALVKIGEA
jgi:VanZ family protein